MPYLAMVLFLGSLYETEWEGRFYRRQNKIKQVETKKRNKSTTCPFQTTQKHADKSMISFQLTLK